MNSTSQDPVGVIVARFQVPQLHEGHRYTIEYVAKRHADVLIILGRSYAPSDRNPLSFEMRKRMIELAYTENEFVIVPSDSLPSSHAERSRRVDEIIRQNFPDRNVVIYGARDSFIDNYQGTFVTSRVPTVFAGSATEIRKDIKVIHTPDFRAGIIYAMVNSKSHSHPAVDVAVTDSDLHRILLVGKSAEEGKLRFPGVFFDPEVDMSYEVAALRCVAKELPTVIPEHPEIIGSCRIKDWRYDRTKDGVVSLLLRAEGKSEVPLPGRGVDTVKWVDVDQAHESLIECHIPLLGLLLGKWKN